MLQSNSVFSLVESDLCQRRYSSAMAKLVKLSNSHSKDLNFLNLLAKTQIALADFTGLIKTLEVKSNITQTSADSMQLMSVLYSQGRLNEALDVAFLLQSRDLSSTEARLLSQYLVKIYLEFSDYEGIQEVIDACDYAAQDDLMLWAMGLVRLASGNKNQALELFRKSVGLNGANDQAWVSLAILHEEMGDRELALANLEKALDANPHNSTGLKLMAKWCRRDIEQTQSVMNKVRHYLSRYEFDEEISLCHMQMSAEIKDLSAVRFEVEKLYLSNPKNAKYAEMKSDMKKRSEDGMKTL